MATSHSVPERPSDVPERDSDDPVTFTRTIKPPAPPSWWSEFRKQLTASNMLRVAVRWTVMKLLVLTGALLAGGMGVLVYCIVVPNPTRFIKILPPWPSDEAPIIALILVSATTLAWVYLTRKIVRRLS
jgi:hypothetical protein